MLGEARYGCSTHSLVAEEQKRLSCCWIKLISWKESSKSTREEGLFQAHKLIRPSTEWDFVYSLNTKNKITG